MTVAAEAKKGGKLSVFVLYNGVPREFDAPESSAVQSVLSRAMAHFGVAGQPDFALFTEGNAELNPSSSLKDSGVVDGQRLVLRPRTVRSGDE